MAVLILLLSLSAYTQIKVSRIEQKFPPLGEFVATANGEVRIHYLRKGSGIPVVMLHGRDGLLQEFTLSVFGEVAADFEAIALDRPGYGYSECLDPDKLTTKAQAQLINEALHKLNLEKPIIVGHSYGGGGDARGPGFDLFVRFYLANNENIAGSVTLGGAPLAALIVFSFALKCSMKTT